MTIPLKHMPDLSERLLYVRRLKDLTQTELAEMVGTTQQAIQQAESGKARNPRYLAKMAHLLDIPHEWLAMNIIPKGVRRGFSEKGEEILTSFYSMPKKDQELMLQLMKSRRKK